MENKTNDYHISFFRPTTPRAKSSRNLVLILVAIWAVAIFGFQFLLRIIEKPTPEPIYYAYEGVWDNINDGNASPEDMLTYGNASLYVLSKVFIDDAHRQVLDQQLNGALFSLADDDQRKLLTAEITSFNELKSGIDDITDPAYVEAKLKLGFFAGDILGLQANDVRITILPLELHEAMFTNFIPSQEVPAIMSKYLIHNRSFLTDTRFLGFPFHYFYTAVFLLVLFVFLCWLYCVRTDYLDKVFGIVETV